MCDSNVIYCDDRSNECVIYVMISSDECMICRDRVRCHTADAWYHMTAMQGVSHQMLYQVSHHSSDGGGGASIEVVLKYYTTPGTPIVFYFVNVKSCFNNIPGYNTSMRCVTSYIVI